MTVFLGRILLNLLTPESGGKDLEGSAEVHNSGRWSCITFPQATDGKGGGKENSLSKVCPTKSIRLSLPSKHSYIPLSSPRGARAFHVLRRYHNRPLQLNWGPENVHFGKTHFWDPNINVKFFFFWKLKELPGATFLCFEFSTRVPKNGPKIGTKFKKRRKMTKTTYDLGGHSI